jgi:archaeal preflagellin peptidase FlaK
MIIMMPLFIYPMFLITLICLGYYVYQDFKFREINIVPMIFLSIFAFLYNLYFFVRLGVWNFYLVQILITCFFVGVIFTLGKITVFAYIGEGDLLTIIFISITSGLGILYAPVIFLASLVAILFIPLILFFYNLFCKHYTKYSFFDNIFLMSLGYPLLISKINKFHTPLEKISIKNGRIKRIVNLKPNTDPKSEIYDLKKTNSIYNLKYVWVSPLIPFVVPIFISYLVFSVLSLFNCFLELGKYLILYI